MRQELGVPDTDVDGSDCREDTVPLFWTYFVENWHKCREMWCSYLRDNVVHLGNNTNNRLESSWQKIKTIVDQNVEIDETVTSLIWWAKVKQKMFTTEMARVGQVFDPVHHTTVELTRLAQMVSRYAFDVVKEQYDIATNADTYYEVRDEGNQLYVVASASTTCKVDTSTWTSYCMLGVTQKLPCRHLLYLRRRLNLSALIPFGYIDDRWRFNSTAMLDRFLGSDYEVSGYSESNFIQDQAPLGTTQKYKDSLVQAKRIAESISQFGGRQYQQSQRILDTIACAFTEGRLDDLDVAVAQLRSGQSGNYELTEATYRDAQSAEPAESGLETQSAAVTVQEAAPTCPEAPVADGGTNSDTPFSEVNIDSEPDVVILDDHSDEDEVPATLQSVQPKSKPVHLWSVHRGLKAAGRPKITAKQRKFARRKKMTEMKKMCMERQRAEPIADDSIHALAEAVYGDLLTSREWSSSLSKFKIVEGLPTVAEQPGLCIAVPAANPGKWRENAQICRVVLPSEWVAKISSMLDECKSDYYGHMKVVLRDEEILLKFEVGRDTLYPKLTGDYIRAMNIWDKLWATFRWLESTITWVRTIDLHAAKPSSVFADAADYNVDDVCTCLQYANLQDEEELVLLRFAMKRELEDVCITAALDVICSEVDARPDSLPTRTFTPQLMAMDDDAARVAWLESNDIVKDATNHIVGAVLLGGDHWCALCISLERWTYTVMDPRNDKKSIDLLDELFKNVFNPLLNQDKRWKRVVNRDYQQMDGVSCGIWVLAFIESYLYQSYDAPGDVDYLRYRYLVKVLLA
ncbi:hypothetical protein PR002_g24932 [Phytophthora rubi]|uniref:Ubiquitin-like protease family profile domain-containing protein n=2 Tax=Phytophthora TaxID=4783 RepID=A0A6A3I4G5_9STRA|nr:hypothetical protein PR002_g24932 [Phytophthora rubi]